MPQVVIVTRGRCLQYCNCVIVAMFQSDITVIQTDNYVILPKKNINNLSTLIVLTSPSNSNKPVTWIVLKESITSVK